VKLAMAIIGISSIHLLKTFINAGNYKSEVIAQTAIHIVFLLSAMAIAYCDQIRQKLSSHQTSPVSQYSCGLSSHPDTRIFIVYYPRRFYSAQRSHHQEPHHDSH
jgi:hypothetical protein